MSWNDSVMFDALAGQSLQQPDARHLIVLATARDIDPERGSHAVTRDVSLNKMPTTRSTLNRQHTLGSNGRAFCWGIVGFGWGQASLL